MMIRQTDNVDEAVAVLKNNGVVLTACDTVLGLLAPFNEDGLQRLKSIKERSNSKAFITLIPSLEYLDPLVEDKKSIEKEWIKSHWPGPLTIVFKRHSSCSSRLTGGHDTIAIRYPNFHPINTLLERLNAPVFSTSVNKQGEAEALSIDAVSEDILRKVDIIYNGGQKSPGIPSTIVSARGSSIDILRQGAIAI